mmetsp:Transcript_3755/g.9659  ORF Transcript_3755/g.9659 Transcript_3755/m.9659 type:complete len:114 (-) Transcript_3755:206-547(-)
MDGSRSSKGARRRRRRRRSEPRRGGDEELATTTDEMNLAVALSAYSYARPCPERQDSSSSESMGSDDCRAGRGLLTSCREAPLSPQLHGSFLRKDRVDVGRQAEATRCFFGLI